MINNHKQNVISKVLSISSLTITVLIYTGINFDPVNLPKLVVLVVSSGYLFGLIVADLGKLTTVKKNKYIYILIFFISVSIFNSVIGASPFTLNFYGIGGRNTGALTFLCLGILAISSSQVIESNFRKRIIYALFLAGIINVFYATYVTISKKDPIPWNNVFGHILGTFGNPNFISAFFGICFSVTLAFFIKYSGSSVVKYLFLASLPIYLILIKISNSLQGFLVAILGAILVTLALIRQKYTFKIQVISALFFSSAIFLGILGMLQHGPLKNFLYKPSVSFRGEYWRAGLRMFEQSPIWGIGLDSYGDFYRRLRSTSSIIAPGVQTVTDAAHNVYIDILAGGGLLLFIPYLILQLTILKTAFHFIRNNKKYDAVFMAIFVGWITYSAQALVSINQIGVAIWGWIFMGLMLSYKNNSENKDQITQLQLKKKLKNKQDELSAANFIFSISSAIIFLMIVLPLVTSEYNWKKAIIEKDASKIQSKVTGWPETNQRYATTMKLFLDARIIEKALDTARSGVLYNSNFYDGWYVIYNFTNNPNEKENALKNMRRLDPLNPAFKK